MTIKIEIEAHPDRGDMGQQVEQAMSALGFARKSPTLRQVAEAAHDAGFDVNVDLGLKATAETVTQTEPAAIADEILGTNITGSSDALDTRAVGSADEGRSRRTKAQIAEDAEFEELAASKGISLDKLNAGIASAGRAAAKDQLEMLDSRDKQIDEPQAAISTGEERIGPEDVQDAADEAAETEKSGLAPIDVLRRLLGDYQKAHGMPAAVKLCQEGGLIGAPIHDLDEAGIEKAIAAMSVSPLSLAKSETQQTKQVAPKTKADLIEAMMRYADKFDGTRDQSKMKATLKDCPKIFVGVFGDAVTKLSQVPEDGYGKAVAAIDAAIEADPFGRA